MYRFGTSLLIFSLACTQPWGAVLAEIPIEIPDESVDIDPSPITVPEPGPATSDPAAPAPAAPESAVNKLSERVLRLGANLVDGSYIIGIPELKSLALRTSFAKMDVPLERVVAVTLKEDRETTELELVNGDRLTGVLDLAEVGLKTVFGDIRIKTEHLNSVSVIPAGQGEKKAEE